MLAFRVIQLEQHRTLQQNAAKLYLPAPPLVSELSPGSKFAIPNRRLPGPLAAGEFARPESPTSDQPTPENETYSQTGCCTSNWFWPRYRRNRKQRI